MNVIILTSSLRGSAAVQIQHLLKSPLVNIKMVIYSEGKIRNKKKFYRRKLLKSYRVGIFGTLNGIRMRRWYTKDAAAYREMEPINKVCKTNDIPFHTSPTINCKETILLFQKANADLGLSLGNGYISSSVFEIPKNGMINVHHEELPAYQNAQSIIWQIFNNSRSTGYTIHRIDRGIDTGKIYFQENFQIEYRKTLADTVAYNYSLLWRRSSLGLVKVLENYHYFSTNAIPQKKGRKYTTPSFSQYFRIWRNFIQHKKESFTT